VVDFEVGGGGGSYCDGFVREREKVGGVVKESLSTEAVQRAGFLASLSPRPTPQCGMLQPALSLLHDDTIAIHVLQLYFALVHACYPAPSFVNQFQSMP
jgi:hypothetical protein